MNYTDILDFWFSERVKPLQFVKSDAFDAEITETFMSTYEAAASGELSAWQESVEGILALIIVFDQFPRNMFRDTPKAFATDAKALDLSKLAIAKGWDLDLAIEHRSFLYMPFMHSESLEDQEESVRLYKEKGAEHNYAYAVAHRDIVRDWGRFPHRNKILGRETTPEEAEFLKTPGSGF